MCRLTTARDGAKGTTVTDDRDVDGGVDDDRAATQHVGRDDHGRAARGHDAASTRRGGRDLDGTVALGP
jgi:hypothetical protein